MAQFFGILVIGFVLGMRHATDPDHVIAVSTIVTRYRKVRHAATVGLLWGFGHMFTVCAVGAGIILFGLVIPPRLGLAMEFVVGLMLISLGLVSLNGLRRSAPDVAGQASATEHDSVHRHAHPHGDYVHVHPHQHNPESHPHPAQKTVLASLDRLCGGIGVYQLARPLIVGVVHGIAGSAAVALLVLTTIRNPREAAAYLLVFGIGTITGMMLITIGMASTFAFVGRRSANSRRHMRLACGLLSIGFGFLMAYHVGVVQGLFATQAHWTPR